MGGIGCGTIGRGYRGDFRRWSLQAGVYHHHVVWGNQFSVNVKSESGRSQSLVLFPGKPKGKALKNWNWSYSGKDGHYFGLFPRAWTSYHNIFPNLELGCKQISPVIANNYKESSFPVSTFVWTIQNTGDEPLTVSVMFTFQNGMGIKNDFSGGHSNKLYSSNDKNKKMIGILLNYVQKQPQVLLDEQEKTQKRIFNDPLTFCIATSEDNSHKVTYLTKFTTSTNGKDIWDDFSQDGLLNNINDSSPSLVGETIGAGLVSTVIVPPRETNEIIFVLSWDIPIARFGKGHGYYRRYTKFYGREGKYASSIAQDALLNYRQWDEEINLWQKPILENSELPDWYKCTLFNELYYIVDGGTIWTDGEVNEPLLSSRDNIGHFAYLEGHEYLLYNTYDVHFNASFALIMLWPQIELSLQKDIAKYVEVEDLEKRILIASGTSSSRKLRGSVPHDIGTPLDDPWVKINAYKLQDVSRWKDLNPKFVLQIYRDYIATNDKKFLEEVWDAVQDAIKYSQEFDSNDDGMIENEGFPDQTYDVWSANGISAYTGGLWLACLTAGSKIAEILGHNDIAIQYNKLLERGKKVYEEKLWTGSYYKYDESKSNQATSIMADQLAGYWYCKSCNLRSYIPEDRAKTTLQTIFEYNIMKFQNGTMGAINGMKPNGQIDKTSLQSQEVWEGVTYALAATMVSNDMIEQAFLTAKGIYNCVYQDLGYWYMSPEAWMKNGSYRSFGYMRALNIWAIQWFLKNKPTISKMSI